MKKSIAEESLEKISIRAVELLQKEIFEGM
jgi:hypothetical protein